MKKNIFLILILSLMSNQSFAAKPNKKIEKPVIDSNSFFLQSYATIEYSAPSMSGGGGNSHFQTNALERQIKEFENIAIGAHFRVHKYLGFNINWVQSELRNHFVAGQALSRRANFGLDHYNFSALLFAPKVNNVEFFAELGASDIKSKLNYVDINGNSYSRKAHSTAFLYGGGFQVLPFAKSKDAIRFSIQRYIPATSIISGDYMTVRLGYVKAL